MDDIKALINALPQVVSYIVYGTIFLTIYKFITYKNHSIQIKNYFVECVTLSFVLQMFFEWIHSLWDKFGLLSFDIGSVQYYIITFIITAVLSYVLGMLMCSNKINSLLTMIGIKRTVNKNIWVDIMRGSKWVYLKHRNRDYGYVGMIKYIEEDKDNPKMVLYHYQLRKISSGEVFLDYINNPLRTILLDTNDYDVIEIIERDSSQNDHKKNESFFGDNFFKKAKDVLQRIGNFNRKKGK